jgi:hypothetical protein
VATPFVLGRAGKGAATECRPYSVASRVRPGTTGRQARERVATAGIYQANKGSSPASDAAHGRVVPPFC